MRRSFEVLRLQPLGRTTAVFSGIRFYTDYTEYTLYILGTLYKTKRQRITTTLGKLYVVALFLSSNHHHTVSF